MLERFLLQAAHHLVGLVDRLGDLLPIAMFGLDRLRESDIGSAHLKLERPAAAREIGRSEEHTSELQSLMRISYADFCLKKTITSQATPTIPKTIHSQI